MELSELRSDSELDPVQVPEGQDIFNIQFGIEVRKVALYRCKEYGEILSLLIMKKELSVNLSWPYKIWDWSGNFWHWVVDGVENRYRNNNYKYFYKTTCWCYN